MITSFKYPLIIFYSMGKKDEKRKELTECMIENLKKQNENFLHQWKKITNVWDTLSTENKAKISSIRRELFEKTYTLHEKERIEKQFIKSAQLNIDTVIQELQKMESNLALLVSEEHHELQNLYTSEGELISNEKLKTLYEDEKKSLKELSEMCDCSRNTIKKRLTRYGVGIRLPKGYHIERCSRCGKGVKVGNNSCIDPNDIMCNKCEEITQKHAECCEPLMDEKYGCQSPINFSYECPNCEKGKMVCDDEEFRSFNLYKCGVCGYEEKTKY